MNSTFVRFNQLSMKFYKQLYILHIHNYYKYKPSMPWSCGGISGDVVVGVMVVVDFSIGKGFCVGGGVVVVDCVVVVFGVVVVVVASVVVVVVSSVVVVIVVVVGLGVVVVVVGNWVVVVWVIFTGKESQKYYYHYICNLCQLISNKS